MNVVAEKEQCFPLKYNEAHASDLLSCCSGAHSQVHLKLIK